jgi:hypothetical protein
MSNLIYGLLKLNTNLTNPPQKKNQNKKQKKKRNGITNPS